MAFTGKATYLAGFPFPEIAEDVSDLVGIVSPYETPLLDAVGDPQRAAQSTYHEWLEDSLLPNKDQITATPTNPTTDTTLAVANAGNFRVGDQIQDSTHAELMLVTAVNTSGNTITVTRGYGGTTPATILLNDTVFILGNAALEGDDAANPRFTARTRRGNWTQIFTETVLVSGSDMAVRQLAVADELDYQKQERLREMLRDLENTVINGIAPSTTPQGSAAVRRTMNGIIPQLTTNAFAPGVNGFPSGPALTEPMLNQALRTIWTGSSANIDMIVVNGFQKRQISAFSSALRRYTAEDERFNNLVGIYESDFGVQRVVLSRWVPADAVLMLDSSRLSVLPLAGRSFQYRPLAATGDFERGELIGEYTLELRNQQAHGVIRGLQSA
jgi:hypothetical protein